MRADARFLSGWVLFGAGNGAIAGGVIGGVGGRIAMFVLRLTSTNRLRGVETDDGFEIGVITFDTVTLIILTIIIGAVGGVAYVALRNFIGPRWRMAAWTLACGAVGGSVIVNDEGIDFTFLEPLWLAVLMFTIIPAAGGAWTAYLVERGRGSVRPRDWRFIIGGLALTPMLFGPILVAGPVFVGVLLAGRIDTVRAGVNRWWSRALALGVYTVLVAISSRALFQDVTTIL